MPNVTAPTRQMGNGDVVTQFVDSVGTSAVTYTYPKTQEKFIVKNKGPSSLSVTVAGTTQTVASGDKWEKVADFTSITINAVSGFTAFDAWADEKGSTFDSPEGRYFQSNGGGSGGTGGGSGVLIYADLTSLQAALPNGSATPVWVTADNSWYYWIGALDTTSPTASISPAAGTYTSTQSVTLTGSDDSGGAVTIYYTTDGSTPTQSSAVYSGTALSISATTTLKYFGKDASGNVSAVQTAVYTINTATIPTTPTTPTTPTATAGSNQVALTWTAVSGATSYKVYRGGTLLASPTTNSYTDTTAVNGTAYSYTVSAVNSAGESAQSSAASATPAAAGLTSVTSGMIHSYDLRGGSGYTGTVADTKGTMPLTLTNFKTDGSEGFVTAGLKHAGATDSTAAGNGYAINSTIANLGMVTGDSFTVVLKATLNPSSYSTNFFTTMKDNRAIGLYDALATEKTGRFQILSIGTTNVHPKVRINDTSSTTVDLVRDDYATAASTISAGASPTPVVIEITYDGTTKTASLYTNGTLHKSLVIANHLKFDGINLCSGQKVDNALLIYNRILSGSELSQVSTDLMALS